MCLAKVARNVDRPVPLIQSGWKQFKSVGKELQFQQFQHEGRAAVPLDRWIAVRDLKLLKADDGQPYLTGFHVCSDEKDKWKEATRRVYYRNVTCEGSQMSATCRVARELYVPSDPDGWPPKE